MVVVHICDRCKKQVKRYNEYTEKFFNQFNYFKLKRFFIYCEKCSKLFDSVIKRFDESSMDIAPQKPKKVMKDSQEFILE